MHQVDESWKEADATALEAREASIGHWLDHTINLLEIFEDDVELTKELRAAAASVRMRRNDIEQRATSLRADMADGKKDSS